MELQTIGSQNSERGNAVDLVSFSFLLCSLLSFTPSTLRSFSLSRFTIIFLVVPYTSEKGGHITRRVRFYLCILALYGNGKHYSFFARFGTTNASFPVLFSLLSVVRFANNAFYLHPNDPQSQGGPVRRCSGAK